MDASGTAPVLSVAHHVARRLEIRLHPSDLIGQNLSAEIRDRVEPPAAARLDIPPIRRRGRLLDQPVFRHPPDTGVQGSGAEQDRSVRPLLHHPLDVISVSGTVGEAEEDVERGRRERSARANGW